MITVVRRKVLAYIYQVANCPVVSNSPRLLAAYELYWYARRTGRCLRCKAFVVWPDATACRAYRRTDRRPPCLVTHEPHCLASGESLRLMITAQWS